MKTWNRLILCSAKILNSLLRAVISLPGDCEIPLLSASRTWESPYCLLIHSRGGRWKALTEYELIMPAVPVKLCGTSRTWDIGKLDSLAFQILKSMNRI